MRKLLLTIAALLYLVVSLLLVLVFNGVDIGIAEEISTQDIPNQHIIFYSRTPFGIIPTFIPGGALNAGHEGIHWDTIEKYIEREKTKQKFREKDQKSMEKYKKKYPEKFGKKQPI